MHQDDTKKIQEHVDSVLSRINFTTNISKSVEECDLVVEAIPEDIKLKHKMFEQIDQVCLLISYYGTLSFNIQSLHL